MPKIVATTKIVAITMNSLPSTNLKHALISGRSLRIGEGIALKVADESVTTANPRRASASSMSHHGATLSNLLLLALLLAAVVSVAGQSSQSRRNRIQVAEGTFVLYPQNWSRSPINYRNAVELVTSGAAKDSASVQVRVLITSERRRNHAEAVRRMEEIAVEVEARTRFFTVGGWPALERRYSAPLPSRGPEESEPTEDEKVRESLSLRVTVAVAAGDLLIRVEGTLAPGADRALADQVSAIGRSLSFTNMGSRAEANQVVRRLSARPPVFTARPRSGKAIEVRPGLRRPGPPVPKIPSVGVPVNAQTQNGELEVAVSNNGQNVVIASNGGFSFSTNSGATFTFGGATPATTGGTTPATFPADGDPSLAVGASGNFYFGFIGFPDGTAAANSVTGCSTGISVSTNGGQTFTFRNHATVCPNGIGVCFPDQEHIAADRVNASATGGDQVYSVWRNFAPIGAPLPTAQCSALGTGTVTPSIVCSNDGGANWTAAPVAIGVGDLPRVTVGRDGFVYAVYRSGASLMLNRFSSCNAGLAQQPGFPVTVTTVTDVTCPVPGLDRCNNGNLLSSHTVAVDDTNDNHIYVAFATNTAAGNEDVVVRDSSDAGATWPRSVNVSNATAARRFMPWLCTQNGTAFVSWYDRSGATSTNNDLTNYFLGVASLQGGVLRAGPQFNLSVNADPQCASGWPCAPRGVGDSEACSVQPQLAGICSISGARCDFSGGCPPGQGACGAGGGCPKYGDYNGNACAAGRIYTAWASATAPPGLAAVAGITVFTSAFITPRLTVRKVVVPPDVPNAFNLRVDGGTVASNMGDGGSTGPRIVGIGTHTVSETSSQFPASYFNSSIGGDCAPNGSISLAEGDLKTCTITNTITSLGLCMLGCAEDRDACMAEVGTPGAPLASQCARQFANCRGSCTAPPPATRLRVVKVLSPAGSPGLFNLQIDGVTRAANVGNAGATGLVIVSAGAHTVGETAGTGTGLANYATIIGGDCAPSGSVTLAVGDNKTCTITNTGLNLPPPPQLRVNNVILPAADPGRFNLRIDGVTKGANVGGGGSTGPIVVSVGTHTVSETAAAGTSAADYTRVIGGDCAANGTVTLAAGDNKTCTITNTLSLRAACLRSCEEDRDACMAEVGTPGAPLASQCAAAFANCRRNCPP